MDFRKAIFAASSRGSRPPQAQSGAPRARYGKFHRPLAAFLLVTPRGARLCARGRARSPRPIDCLKHLLRKKSKSYQILVLNVFFKTLEPPFQEFFRVLEDVLRRAVEHDDDGFHAIIFGRGDETFSSEYRETAFESIEVGRPV